MRSRALPVLLITIIAALIAFGTLYNRMQKNMPQSPAAPAPSTTPLASAQAPSGAPAAMAPSGTFGTVSPSGTISPSGSSGVPAMTGAPTQSPNPIGGNQNVDLTVDANGLSKATVVITTDKGVIKYKFYSKDAPNTVNRMVELINKGFYNGVIFHRVEPGFVIQGGDPTGTGMGGSGQKLKAEFNARRHIDGAVAMARTNDPDSADSQFYISMGTHPHLDRQYTVFGQVTEGMDVVRKIRPGDKMVSVKVE